MTDDDMIKRFVMADPIARAAYWQSRCEHREALLRTIQIAVKNNNGYIPIELEAELDEALVGVSTSEEKP